MSKPHVVFLPRQSAVTGRGPVENWIPSTADHLSIWQEEAFGWESIVLVCFRWYLNGVLVWEKQFCILLFLWAFSKQSGVKPPGKLQKTVNSQSKKTKAPFQFLLKINILYGCWEYLETRNSKAICFSIEYSPPTSLTSLMKHRNKVKKYWAWCWRLVAVSDQCRWRVDNYFLGWQTVLPKYITTPAALLKLLLLTALCC